MNELNFIVQFDPGGGDETLWVEDMITPSFGNPMQDSYPKLSRHRSEALRMIESDAREVARQLSFEGAATVIDVDVQG